jgi:5-methylcytosine-specific restriction endonuclease McrA
MPYAPPRHCPRGHPPFTGSRCPQCAAAYDRRRGTRSARGYDADWQTFRRAYLRRHPICCVVGCGQPATDVDHITALRDGGPRLDAGNCRAMCRAHHSQRTIADEGANRGKGVVFLP